METVAKIVTMFLLVAVAVAFISLLLGFPVMWLWNWLMPTIFGLKTITFWQAVGLMFLSSLLFKSTSSSSSK